VDNISGHSKYDENTHKLHTFEYDVINNCITYIQMNPEFGKHKKVVIKTRYIPIIHDFSTLENGCLFLIDFTNHMELVLEISCFIPS
jgi:carotenoid cleavage dioxygenase-like enzyme